MEEERLTRLRCEEELDAYYARFDGIWAHGDHASFTPYGGVVIHGRSDTTLNPGGVRIGTAEIYRVVEALPWQNAARVLFQMDAPMDRILRYAAAVEDLLAPLRPALVYLERRDAAATFRSTAAERGAAWTAPTVAIITDAPHARRHGLRGVRGALRWIAMYKEFLDAMRAASRLPTLVLDDGAPWDARYAAIRVFLGV